MRIAFVGGGTMAEAIIKGVLTQKLADPGQVFVGEPVESRRNSLAEKYRISTTPDNRHAIAGAQAIVLAVKPQNLRSAFASLKGNIGPDQTVVSIVAGARLAALVEGLGHSAVVRVMPNTPGQIGAGVSAWTASDDVTEDGRQIARAIVQTLGVDVYVDDEKYIEMATALSASGPAYVFTFLDALIEAGVYLGMDRDMARTLSLHTVLGSAKLMLDTGESPARLREMVSSPGGTTVEALLALEEGAFRATVINAVVAAHEKALQLGEQS